MLKVSGSGVMSGAAAGIDRARVGERLQATLAGLHELRLLKEKQGDLVNWALTMDRGVEPVPVCFYGAPLASADGPRPGAEEQRLEATLAALKQQLARVRRQDVGLKTHLLQLDHQISELKLDVGKTSSDQLESDSRPSSGFYELSDAGSCSLSNSCTSVYSESLSSSQTSLLPGPAPPGHAPAGLRPRAPRRLSADETAAQPPAPLPRAGGLHLGSSRIRARQRPVSTGDLDRMLTPGLIHFNPVDVKKPSLCPDPRAPAVDPRFQSSLVSRSGAEVYLYPSPLHAVALQSPIFSLGGEPAAAAPPATPESQGPPARQREAPEAQRPLGYIDQLLRRSASRIDVRSEAAAGRERGAVRVPSGGAVAGGGGASRPDGPPPRAPVRVPLPPQPAIQSDFGPPDGTRPSAAHANANQEVSYGRAAQTPPRGPEVSYRYSYPATAREYSPAPAAVASAKAPSGDANERAGRPDPGAAVSPGRGGAACEQRGAAARGSGAADDGQGPEGGGGPGHDFVRARFVPAGSQRVKVRQADRKTRAVKLRRRGGAAPPPEKPPLPPRGVRHQQGHAPPPPPSSSSSSNERMREAGGGGGRGDGAGEPRGPAKGGAVQRPGGRSGSESSLCSGAGLSHSRRVGPPQTLKLGKAAWPSDAEMFRAASSSSGRSAPTPHTGRWGGPPPRPALLLLPPPPSSSSSSSFLSSLDARYPPAPPARRRPAARCESEYSAECASLFHSTIAESSEGELSDATVNRFGDSESSRASGSDEEEGGRRRGGGRGWCGPRPPCWVPPPPDGPSSRPAPRSRRPAASKRRGR